MKCVMAGSRSIGLKNVNGVLVQMTLEECPFIEEAFTSCEWSGKIREIVSGTARGVDNLGEQLARKLGIEVALFPADWSMGRGGGHVRNKAMAKYADFAIVIYDGISKGSKNMIEQMRKLKKPCLVFVIRNGKVVENGTD